MAEESRPEESRPARDVNWGILAPLLIHVVFTHVVVGVVRVTISYRTIELGLPVIWLGVISAGFAILPVFTAVRIGRYIDRGHDAHAGWMGSALMLVACLGLWMWPGSGLLLLLYTIVLGTGHMFLMAAQQMLTVRCANARGRDLAFGNFMVAVSIGQGLGPMIVGWVGGGVAVPTTAPLFVIGVITGLCCMAASLLIRPAPPHERPVPGPAVPVLELLRRPGMIAVLAASVVTVTASDLLVVYLPILGAERHIEASHIGTLLFTRSMSSLVARIFYTRLILTFGRMPLTLGSTLIGAAAFVLMTVPSLPVMYVAAVIIGVGLGIAATLTLSGIVEVAPPEARGTAMTMRITGNRMALAFMPFVAGVVAAATGAVGILILTAGSLTACAVGMQVSQRRD